MSILKKIIENKIKTIIIVYTYFTDFKKDIYVIQNNLERPIPNCWISKTLITKFLKINKCKKINFYTLKNNFYTHKSITSDNFCAYNLVINTI